MPEKVIVLGSGRIGSAIAIDLNDRYDVTIVDLDTERFPVLRKKGITTRQADLSVPGEIRDQVSGFDMAVGALPGQLGYASLSEIIEAGINGVDISFMPEDYFSLNVQAINRGVTAVVDCGLAPGMGNLILGHHNQNMKVDTYRCYVGGLPLVREWPYEYKALFSPADVIAEYTRPARLVENEHIITREALSDLELLNFPFVGTLEAWNSDGLRSLLTTMKIPNMLEKTLRYPGTTAYIKALRDTGFFSKDEISIEGTKIKPVDFTSKLLFPNWKLKKGEGDRTVMKIIIRGSEKGKPVQYTYELYDEYDPGTDTISMARTTGYTCTAVVDLMLRKGYRRRGICPPEYIGTHPENFEFVIAYLRKRGVFYKVNREKL